MSLVKVYKVKIRENILRQLIFTDRTIIITIAIIISILIFYIAEDFSIEFKFLITFIFVGVFILLASLKIDRQSLGEIFKRLILFIFRKKNVRF